MTAISGTSKSRKAAETGGEAPADAESAAAPEIVHMLDGLTDACLVADEEGSLRYANESARELFHLRGRVAGRKLPAVLADRNALQVISQAAQTSRPKSTILTLTLSSNGPRTFSVSVVPVHLPGEGLLLRIALHPAEKANGSDLSRDEAQLNTVERLGDPLTIIQGYLENLLDGDIRDPVVMRQCLSAMQRQTTQIQRILRGLQK